MKNIFLIATNTIKEVRRHRIFYALGSLAIFMMFIGIILGPLSLNEKVRLSINFALTASHLGIVLITIYFSSTLLSREIERRTIVTLFVRPISRMQFILGKFFGFSVILAIISALLFTTVALLHLFYGQDVGFVLVVAFWGILLEALILLSLAFFFSSFTSSFVVFVYSFFIYVIGHSANGITFFLGTGEDSFLRTFISLVVRVFPNFEKMNWRVQALYQDHVMVAEYSWSSVYAFSWIMALLVLTALLFERKTIV